MVAPGRRLARHLGELLRAALVAGLTACSSGDAADDGDAGRRTDLPDGSTAAAPATTAADAASAPTPREGGPASDRDATVIDATDADVSDAGDPATADASSLRVDAATSDAGTDLGEGDGQDVVGIGDSWMVLIHPHLAEASTRAYRMHAVDGARVLDGAIGGQYTAARAADPDVKTVVMTGGGNDLFGACSTAEGCESTLADILTALEQLWNQMATDGVHDVVMIDYSSDAGPAGLGAAVAALDQDARLLASCEAAPLRCHVVSTDDLVMGDLPDGIHPSAAAAQRIADAVYQRMVEMGTRR